MAHEVALPQPLATALDGETVHELKVDPLDGEAARVTLVPATTISEQSLPQLMPVPVIVPAPVPVDCTDTV